MDLHIMATNFCCMLLILASISQNCLFSNHTCEGNLNLYTSIRFSSQLSEMSKISVKFVFEWFCLCLCFGHCLCKCPLRDGCPKKNGKMWEFFPNRAPPLPPVWEFFPDFTFFFGEGSHVKNNKNMEVGFG